MKQIVDAVCFDGSDHGLVNCGNGAGMPASKSDEVLVRLFDGTKTFTQ